MLFLLPGMGADHRMYAAPAWQTLPEARLLDWPEHRGEATIAAIAARVIAEAGIRDAGHLIAMTHARECAAFLRDRLPRA
jgi:hypothetical protein